MKVRDFMKLFDGTMIIIVAIAVSAVLIGATNYIWDQYWPDDCLVEEIVEQAIEQKTGLNLDLTPNSPEGVEARQK